MAKIKRKHSITVADTFTDFPSGKKAVGISEKTLATYGQHFSANSKHLSPAIPIDGLNKADLEACSFPLALLHKKGYNTSVTGAEKADPQGLRIPVPGGNGLW